MEEMKTLPFSLWDPLPRKEVTPERMSSSRTARNDPSSKDYRLFCGTGVNPDEEAYQFAKLTVLPEPASVGLPITTNGVGWRTTSRCFRG